MAKFTIERNYIHILGEIWMPYGAKAALEKIVSDYDIENMRDDNGNITRDSVQLWLDKNAGDFSRIIDFRVSVKDVEIPWESDDNECEFVDLMWPCEE